MSLIQELFSINTNVAFQSVLCIDVFSIQRCLYREGSNVYCTVVDVYSAWCGPCKAVLPLFRRIKNELGDELLRFVTAKTDTIDSLEQYREKSKPTFLFFAVSLTTICFDDMLCNLSNRDTIGPS